MVKELISKVLSGSNLTSDEASLAMNGIMQGEWTAAQIAGFLIALKQKGEVAEEVAGFARSMRDHSVRIVLSDSRAVDGCGTGGDGSHSFNISTAASLVAAAAGATVAKHGNRSVSSSCGSADLLEACGADIDPGEETVNRNINECGFGFMFAPRFHPSMKHAIGPRRELGVRTVFNILGPLTNPAGVKRQVIGTYDVSLLPLMADALAVYGSEHVIICHSRDGLDEFSVVAETEYVELKDGAVRSLFISPEEVGLARHPAGALAGGEPSENLRILHEVLSGNPGACRDATLFNAGAMLYVAGLAESIREGVNLAGDAIDSGVGRAKLNEYVAASKK